MGAANRHEAIAEAARAGVFAASCVRAHGAAATVIAG